MVIPALLSILEGAPEAALQLVLLARDPEKTGPQRHRWRCWQCSRSRPPRALEGVGRHPRKTLAIWRWLRATTRFDAADPLQRMSVHRRSSDRSCAATSEGQLWARRQSVHERA